MKDLYFEVVTNSGSSNIKLSVDNLYIAGFAGRDIEKTMKHIEELVKLGVSRPDSIPTYYINGTNLLVQDNEIQVVGNGSSGEVEFIILQHDGELYIGIGSDHTDRDLETVDVPKAKQVCPKPIGSTLWKYSEVKEHWDELIMESWQIIDGTKVLYQSGTAKDLLSLESLIDGARSTIPTNLENILLFSGTVATVNGIKPGSHFFGKITDKFFGRSLEFDYGIKVI